jgi:catechol 2,3-dioxygenase-like lactoylglutathione lyase family enzyme
MEIGMKSHVGHLQFNIGPGNRGFYSELFAALGWKTLYEDDHVLGVGSEGGTGLWFTAATSAGSNNHDALGLNHLGIGVETKADVDTMVDYLRERNVGLLYGTPCNRPEFTSGESELYYSVMFDSPDGVLLEVVYTGPA